MQRTLTISRKYQLGNFQNMDIGTMFIDLPEHLMFNQELIEKLFYLQLVTGDKAYRKYFELDAKLEVLGVEKISQAFKLLDEEINKTMLELRQMIKESKGE